VLAFFGSAQMRHHQHPGSCRQRRLYGGQRRANSRIARHRPLLDRHVQIFTDQDALALKIQTRHFYDFHGCPSLVSYPTNTSLAAPRLVAPGGVAPPRPCPVIMSASSARLARHENPRADRASYLWDRTLGGGPGSEKQYPGGTRL